MEIEEFEPLDRAIIALDEVSGSTGTILTYAKAGAALLTVDIPNAEHLNILLDLNADGKIYRNEHQRNIVVQDKGRSRARDLSGRSSNRSTRRSASVVWRNESNISTACYRMWSPVIEPITSFRLGSARWRDVLIARSCPDTSGSVPGPCSSPPALRRSSRSFRQGDRQAGQKTGS